MARSYQADRSARAKRTYPLERKPHFGQFGWCKWCGERVPDVIDGKRSTQRLWHPACKYEFNLHTVQPVQFDYLVQRDGEHCAWPGCGETPFKWLASQYVKKAMRQNCLGYRPGEPGWWDIFWDRPDKPWLDWTDEEREIGAHLDIERVCALEIDHKTPLWEVADLPDEKRRWYFGPENLWLLCPKHHKSKTKAEAKRRAHIRRLKRNQLDLALPPHNGRGGA
jgi:hypothetical protein